MLTDILPPAPLLMAFLAASFVLAVTPGPGVFYIVARSALQGRHYGLASVGGVALGNLCNALGASLGLAAVFAVSTLAFTVVKWMGAAYLIYLGARILWAGNDDPTVAAPPPERLGRIVRDGFVVALFNPKTALFFAAFLPQFMHSQASIAAQSVFLGTLFVLIAAVTDTLYAFVTSGAAKLVTASRGLRTAGRYLTGGAFIGLGVMAAFSGGRAEK